MTRSAVAVGIDLGGTGTKLVAIDSDGNVRGQATHATPRDGSPADALAFLTRHITEVAGIHRFDAIGIGASGPIGQDDRIHNPDTLPAFTDIPLVDRLQNTYQVPVAIDTDAVAAAVGEHRYGRTPPARSMLVVTLGTGIGSCLLLDGAPFRGGDSIPPEGGHLTVPNAPPCYCGRPHCFEQAASRAALERIAVATIGHVRDGSAALPALCAMADQGHPDALRAFKTYGTALGDGLATLLEVYRPSEVVLAGSGAAYTPYFKKALDDGLAPLAPWVPTAPIRATQLGDLIGALGAAELAARKSTRR